MLPDYWIERPPITLDRSTRSAIDAFLALAEGDRLLDVDAFLQDKGVTTWCS